jgi:acyl carrier protein
MAPAGQWCVAIDQGPAQYPAALRPVREALTVPLPRRFPAAAAEGPNERDRPVTMTSQTFDVVAKVISDTSEIPIDQITPEAHAIDDLGIDSLDFLDIVFALDKKFGIKIPLERWTEEVNQGKAAPEDYFVLKNLVARIDELIAAKSAAT